SPLHRATHFAQRKRRPAAAPVECEPLRRKLNGILKTQPWLSPDLPRQGALVQASGRWWPACLPPCHFRQHSVDHQNDSVEAPDLARGRRPFLLSHVLQESNLPFV